MQPREPVLPDIVKSDLIRILSALPLDRDPLTIAFATNSFAPLLMNWLAHAKRAGITKPLVVAMDGNLAGRLAAAGVPCIRHAYDGSLRDLWVQRILFFEFLAGQGIDFIHSDVDAVWLSDPRPFCFADSGFDLVFSQGTTYPAEVWRRWGFVVCCGLFAVRARPATANFFAAARRLAPHIGDDQVAVNYLLVRDGLVWNTEGRESYDLPILSQSFRCYRQMLDGFSELLNMRVSLLPHHLVPRLPTPRSGPLVKHPLGPGNPKEKATLLRKIGCWTPGRD